MEFDWNELKRGLVFTLDLRPTMHCTRVYIVNNTMLEFTHTAQGVDDESKLCMVGTESPVLE